MSLSVNTVIDTVRFRPVGAMDYGECGGANRSYLVSLLMAISPMRPVDKDDNEVKLGTLHRFPGICLTAE